MPRANLFGMEKAEITVEESTSGMVKLVSINLLAEQICSH